MKYLIVFIVFLFSCSNSKKLSTNIKEEHILDFENCYIETDISGRFDYKKIKIVIPKKVSRIKKKESHGFCEYQFLLEDGAFFYASTDIYNGSKLNSENLFEIRKEVYFKNRSLATDTIINYGVNNNKCWAEHILGNVVLGYVDVDIKDKDIFNEIILTFEKKQ